ncbi:DegT/DnrJ/EryC1/StrS family aminotransferase [Aliamphritea spongicola]
MEKKYHLEDHNFPVSSKVSNQHVSLPIFPSMTDCEVDHVITAVKIFC